MRGRLPAVRATASASATSKHGWRLDHDELLTAKITQRSVFGSATRERHQSWHRRGRHRRRRRQRRRHCRDRARAPSSICFRRHAPDGKQNFAECDLCRGGHLDRRRRAAARGRAQLLSTRRAMQPDILVEFHPPVQEQIRLAVRRGITVIEPAGNGRHQSRRSFRFSHTPALSRRHSPARSSSARRDRHRLR